VRAGRPCSTLLAQRGEIDGMSPYLLVKYLHVLLAIVAVGFNASYAIWLSRAGSKTEDALIVLRGIKFLDDRFANPAYALLLLTGLGMTFLAQIPLTTFWITAALVLYVILVVVAVAFYSPTLRRQIAVLESQGATSEKYARLGRRSTLVGLVLMLIVLVIVFLMVTKPTP
jgi:uncharacterized membrane protein